MAWGMNLSGTKNVRSYAGADKLWHATEGWKNQLTSWRPLQCPRKKHVRLVRGIDNYACVLYETAMVTYYSDGRVRLGSHNSIASHEFVGYTAPYGVDSVSHNDHMYWQIETPNGTRFWRAPVLMLTPAPGNKWILLTHPAPQTETVLDRKKAAAVRKLLSHYAKWDKMTTRLAGDSLRFYAGKPHHEDVRVLLNNPEDFELFARLRNSLGPVENFRKVAYELMGASTQQTVPPDRLPRKQT